MQECKQCGTCCQKNGPTLHIEDKYLIESEKISPKNLVTLRQGEYAFDPITNKKISLETDIIKIKGIDENWQCQYYDSETKVCTIYNSRPIECRLLKCWDTKSLLTIINKNLLTREMLFKKIPGLYDLITEHSEKCSYSKIENLLKQIDKDQDAHAIEELKNIVLFDKNLRDLLQEKQPAAGIMSDLLFGRPISKTIKQFNYKLKFTETGLIISPAKLDKILEGSIS